MIEIMSNQTTNTVAKITCECGAMILPSSMKRHILTKKHIDRMTPVPTQEEIDEQIATASVEVAEIEFQSITPQEVKEIEEPINDTTSVGIVEYCSKMNAYENEQFNQIVPQDHRQCGCGIIVKCLATHKKSEKHKIFMTIREGRLKDLNEILKNTEPCPTCPGSKCYKKVNGEWITVSHREYIETKLKIWNDACRVWENNKQ